LFLKKETQEQMWAPTVSSEGQTLPYGLGWFVQQYQGHKLIWHNGYLPDCYSALLMKAPDKQLTFIALANSDALSSPFHLARGNVMTSAFADVFIRLFVLEDDKKTTLRAPEWGANEGQFQLGVTKLTHQAHGY
jgi:Beta-lactamase